MGSESMLQEILWDTKIGWWKVDMARRVLLLSDYLCKTIGTEESEIGYDRFLQSVGEPFRASLKSLMSTDASLFSAEQIFSLCGPRGEVWFRWKVLRRETAADKGLVVSGYAQEISEREALPVDLCSIERMNTLLYRLNNISHTLLSFLHIGSIDEAINKVLTDVLKIFRGSRTYIAEFESSFSLVSRFGKVGYCRFDLVSKEGYGVPQWYYNLGEKEDTPLDQILGVYKHVNSSDRAEVLESIRQVKAGEIDSFSHDLRIDADGRQKWTRINVMRNPLNNDPSKIEMVCVNYDITELKETEKNLIEAKNKAEVSDRLKSAFLANMSHEIRTPLNAIVGFSNLIAETEDPDERREYVAIVQENNELLLKLISDILDLSKIEAGTLEFNDVEFDVNQMCQEIVRSLSLKVLDKPVELRFGDHLPECRLAGDKTRITQVLINFINNALKFTREGSVTLGYRCDDGMMLTFYVEDTGTGIPEQEQESVFERFVKLNSFVQGTGLGLAISKSIVEQMGGRIGLNSEPGKGSCFWFTHPYIRTRSVSAVASDAEMRQPGVSEGKMPVVLVAEDTDSNFLLVSLILKKGYEVLRAHNGAEAVRMCREFAPDVVLMDMKMPVMDGLEATRQIREAGSSVPIIAVTAYAYDSDRAKALDVGCDDYIAKPLTGDVLKKKLRKHLKR